MMNLDSKVIYSCGNFRYQYERNWIEWPKSIHNKAISGIAVRRNNLIVSTRDDEYPIIIFSLDGEYIKSIGKNLQFKRTHGLSVANDGTLWICDDKNSVIYNIDDNGEILRQLGTKGYFSDSGYDPTVRWPYDLFTNKRVAGPFNRPTKIIQSEWGDYYCTDGYGNTAVHRFSENLKLISTWGGPGDEAGRFRLPHSLEIDNLGRIWVCDRQNFRIEIFNREGEYLSEIDRLGYPSELSCYKDFMYLCEGDGLVSIYNADFEKVAKIGYPGCFAGIHSICTDIEGNIYLGRIHGEDTLIQLHNISK